MLQMADFQHHNLHKQLQSVALDRYGFFTQLVFTFNIIIIRTRATSSIKFIYYLRAILVK